MDAVISSELADLVSSDNSESEASGDCGQRMVQGS